MNDTTEIMGLVNGKSDKALTHKQEEFCRLVVQGASLSEAYRQSHYPRKMKDKTVWEKASRLGAMDKVLARIEELRIVGRETVECDHARWLGEIECMAFFDVRRIVGEDGKFLGLQELPDDVAPAIAAFEVDEITIGSGVNKKVVGTRRKYKLASKLCALELLGKALGYFSEQAATPTSVLEETPTQLLLAMRDELLVRKAARDAKTIDASHAEQS